MSEIGSGSGSGYPAAIDTNNTPEVDSPDAGKTKVRADVPNDLAAAIIAIQTELGLNPAGTLTDLVTWLQTEHGTDGTHDNTTVATLAGGQTFTGAMTFGALVVWSKGADVASAASLTLGPDGNYFDVTGTTAITSMNSLGVGTWVTLHFDDALTFTHDGTNLVLPNGIDIETQAGDEAVLIEYASGDWRLISYTKLPGEAVQSVYVQDGNVNTGNTTVPADDTIPQNDEGDEYMTLAITPKNTNNLLVIDSIAVVASSTTTTLMVMSLFQDSTADSLSTISETVSVAGGGGHKNLRLLHEMTAGTTSATTFKIRVGSGIAGTTTFNGTGGSRLFAGIMGSFIRITEYRQ